MNTTNENIDRLMDAMLSLTGEMEKKFEEYSVICGGLSKRELIVLEFIGKTKNVRMRDVSDYLGVAVSTATGIIDKLVTEKYLLREHSKNDRRSIIVKLSKLGHDTFKIFLKQRHTMGESILEALTPEEQSTLIQLFEKSATHIVKNSI